MSMHHFVDKLLFAVVTYRESPASCTAIQSIRKGLPQHCQPTLYIYDNGPHDQIKNMPEAWQTTYWHDPANPGLAKAYNQAGLYARTSGKEWILLMDEDTFFPGDIIDKYANAAHRFSNVNVIAPIVHDKNGILSPFEFRLGAGKRKKAISPGLHDLGSVFVINSGLLIRTNTFLAAGGYDERLPLDFSDCVFVRRLLPDSGQCVVIESICHQQFSGSSTTTQDEAVGRFRKYASAVHILHKFYRSDFSWVRLRLMFRAMRLSLHYRSARFLRIALTQKLQ